MRNSAGIFGAGSPLVPTLAWLVLVGMPYAWCATANRIVAIVNNEVITEADVNARVTATLANPEENTEDAPPPTEARAVILQRLIDQRLILQEASRAQISVTQTDVAQRLETFRSRAGSEEAFQRSLAEAGLSEERLKEEVRDQLLAQRLIDTKVRSMILISPQEVARELDTHPELSRAGDRVRASHLLVRVSDTRSEAAARALITDLRDQLERGGDFAVLAKRYSEDSHAQEGGAMGWVAQGELLPELDAALFTLPVGELSHPIQSRLGFHLVRVEERRTASSLSLTEANQAVYQRLYQAKFKEAFLRWLGELKRKAYIEIPSDAGS